MKRRTFIKTASLGSAALSMTNYKMVNDKTHILTFSFDDGFRKSFYKIADIYEDYGLQACFNVIASGHLKRFKAVDDWILPELMGDFDDWNLLKSRGHEVMPHSWKHLNLARQSPKKAKRLIDKCLDYFEQNLERYKAAEAVFNFPFNASTEEIEQYTLGKVRAIRSYGEQINPLPLGEGPLRLGCSSMGSKNIDAWVQKQIDDFLSSEGGWLILNTHGLDGEGWGPMSSQFLNNLLKQLVKINTLEILPTGEVIKKTP